MSSVGTPVPGEGTAPAPNFQAVGQYIKDLSFENPGAPAGLTERQRAISGSANRVAVCIGK